MIKIWLAVQIVLSGIWNLKFIYEYRNNRITFKT
jgi:hypothetical protein